MITPAVSALDGRFGSRLERSPVRLWRWLRGGFLAGPLVIVGCEARGKPKDARSIRGSQATGRSDG